MFTSSSPIAVRVLVADDSVTQRRFSRVVLESVGIEVVEAENGQVALSALSGGGFDVLILDMKMPVMGGVEVLERLYGGEFRGKSPEVVVCSSDAEVLSAKHPALFAPVHAVLQKPASPADLLNAVNAAIGARARQARG